MPLYCSIPSKCPWRLEFTGQKMGWARIQCSQLYVRITYLHANLWIIKNGGGRYWEHYSSCGTVAVAYSEIVMGVSTCITLFTHCVDPSAWPPGRFEIIFDAVLVLAMLLQWGRGLHAPSSSTTQWYGRSASCEQVLGNWLLAIR